MFTIFRIFAIATMLILSFIDTFGPLVVAMLIAYLLTRQGGTWRRKTLAGVVGIAAGALTYVVLALETPFVLPRVAFDVASLLVASGYIVVGVLGGLVIARRLQYDSRPKSFSPQD
jgi:hypothetical protein